MRTCPTSVYMRTRSYHTDFILLETVEGSVSLPVGICRKAEVTLGLESVSLPGKTQPPLSVSLCQTQLSGEMRMVREARIACTFI